MSRSGKHSTFKKSKSRSVDIEYTTQDLPSLRRKRTIAYKRLTKALEVGIIAANDLTQRDLFFSYHQEVKQIATNFEDAHFTIQEVLDDPETEDNEIQERFDEMYYRVLSINRTLSKSESTYSHGSTSSNIRLPKIVLPTFSGDIKKWPEYFDTFNALIHNSTSITDTEKFHYLLSSLSGDALTVVKPFPMTHEHYHDAYRALTARFKNKRDLAFTCWRDILNVDFKCHDAHEFRKSLDLFEENLSILKTIYLPIGQWDFVLVYHILSKLDTNLRRDFEEKHAGVELPAYEQLKAFLQSKCEASLRDTHFIESTTNKLPQKLIPAQPQTNKRSTTSHTLVATSATDHNKTESNATIVPYTSKCSFCSDFHQIAACSEFLKKSVDERMTVATEKNWCFNCLKPSHQLKDCKSIFSCRTCKRKHHSLLHRDKSSESNQTVSSLVSRSSTHTTVLLATAIVQVKDASGAMHSFRALFDTGSQGNFITESAVKRLDLQLTHANVNVNGLGEAVASILGDVTCGVGTNGAVLFNLDLHVISKICGDQPIAKLNTSGWSHINSLPLADPGFDIPGPIDLLLAADVFADSLLNQHIKGNVNQPTALNSVFGWLLFGKTNSASSTLAHTSLAINNELNSLVQHSCEVDSIPKASLLIPDEALCEPNIVFNHYRDSSEPYMVPLPFNNDSESSLEGSRDMALQRLPTIEQRASRDPDLQSQHADFLSDSVSLDNSEPSALKVIGFKCDPSADALLIEIKPSDRPCTERSIPTELLRFSAPSGLSSPITIQIKSHIQNIWILGIEWDQTPPDEVISTWATYQDQLLKLTRLRIPRNLACFKSKLCELRYFCNSSEIAYGAVINYSRVTDKDGAVHVFLVCSKARVVPLQRILLLRKELYAAVLSNLYRTIVYLSSDSSVVSSWYLTWLSKLVNILTCIYRCINSSRVPHQAKGKEFINNVESHQALMNIVKYVQSRVMNLKSLKAVSKPIQKLNPYVKGQEVHMVGGRIFLSGLKYEQTHPAVLPSDHPLSFLIVDIIHHNFLLPAISKSNPICRIRSHSNYLSCFTIVHYHLILEPLTATPDEDLSNATITRIHRRQMLKASQLNLWSRWNMEFWNSLTQSAKWIKYFKSLSIFSMVIIKNDHQHAPLQWTLAREVYQDQVDGNGIARNAFIKNANNYLVNRPFVKLYPLPVED